MRIILFGAAGDVGSRILNEACARGHRVTAVVRSEAQIAKLPEGVDVLVGDASMVEDVLRLTQSQDLIISAVRPPQGLEPQLPLVTQSILSGAAQNKLRVLMVGGAATLYLPGQSEETVLSAPGFLPESVRAIASACAQQHALCEADTDADWTYLSPAGMLVPGERTGEFRLGRDELLLDEEGNSTISMEDLAVAMLDEAERPQHRRCRFTLAY